MMTEVHMWLAHSKPHSIFPCQMLSHAASWRGPQHFSIQSNVTFTLVTSLRNIYCPLLRSGHLDLKIAAGEYHVHCRSETALTSRYANDNAALRVWLVEWGNLWPDGGWPSRGESVCLSGRGDAPDVTASCHRSAVCHCQAGKRMLTRNLAKDLTESCSDSAYTHVSVKLFSIYTIKRKYGAYHVLMFENRRLDIRIFPILS